MQPTIPPDVVRHALDAVSSSAVFARSPRHQRLLRYLVEELLAGRLANLREIHLGVHVFGRPATSFDPATDTIVRVEARRLRARLQRYYASEGAHLRVVIELPLGSYVPTLRWLSAEPIHRANDESLPVIAVLPLEDLSGDTSTWADALTDEITDGLARMADIRVVARTSSMQFKGARRDIRDIARALSADVLVEGSLQREGEHLRAIVQIITANDGLHLWSDSLVGDVNARFRFFDIVSAMVTRAVPLVLQALHHDVNSIAPTADGANPQAAFAVEPAAAIQPDTPEAVRDNYERGRIAVRVRTTASLARATALFAEVAAAAPEFARGHAALATALLQEVGMTMRSAESAVDAIKSAVNAALTRDPQLPEAHATLGTFHMYYEHDWPNAERALLRAIRFGPSYVSAYRSYAFGLMFMRRFAEADRMFAQARRLDPLDAQTRVHQGLLLFYRRQFADAKAVFSGLLDVNANDVLARTLMAASCLHSGDHADAEVLYRETCKRHPDLSIGLCGLAVTLAYRGQHDEAREVREKLVDFASKAFVSPYQFAMIDCALGEYPQALDGLERAALSHDYNFQCSAVDPTFAVLHGTPQWSALMRRFGMPHD